MRARKVVGLAAVEVLPEPESLRRALCYIDEHAGEDIGIADIAAEARTSARAVQNHFRRYRGCTPLERLVQVRLERAHAELRVADPTRGDTVAAIAGRWRFGHAGRFSAVYRRRFGCPPSETLRT